MLVLLFRENITGITGGHRPAIMPVKDHPHR